MALHHAWPMDRYDDTDTHLGDQPPTPTQQRQVRFKRKASKKQAEH